MTNSTTAGRQCVVWKALRPSACSYDEGISVESTGQPTSAYIANNVVSDWYEVGADTELEDGRFYASMGIHVAGQETTATIRVRTARGVVIGPTR